MIPEFSIREWNEVVPWTESEQVEQDLLICRALTEIYKDEYMASHLAFRGGTALHKLYLSPQPSSQHQDPGSTLLSLPILLSLSLYSLIKSSYAF